jgi:uncharacterized surface protein with fasciclin (FAS1) repeats
MTFNTFAASAAVLAAAFTPVLASAHTSGCTGGMKHTASRAAAQGTIVDIAAGSRDFDTLVAAATAAGLVPTLSGAGPYTIFAPTDEAFAKLPAGTVERLLRPENRAELTRILTYHVVPGRVTSDALVGRSTSARTVQGGTVQVDGRTGVRVNGSTVTTADIAASNGVIHVIDTVLLPPANHASR